MKKRKKAFESEMGKIKRNLNFQRIFFAGLIFISIITIALAYLLKSLEYDFLSSLFQNVFCGLLTGMVVTIWSIWRENSELKKQMLSTQLIYNIESLGVSKLEFPVWTDDMDEQCVFCQENVDRYVFYSNYLQEINDRITKVKSELYSVCEYFHLDEECENVIRQLEILYKKTCELGFEAIMYPDPYFEENAETGEYDIYMPGTPEYMEKINDMDDWISGKSAVQAVWKSTGIELEETEYAELISLANRIDAMLLAVNTKLCELKSDSIHQIRAAGKNH